MTDVHYRTRKNCVIPNFSRKSTLLDWTSDYKVNQSDDGQNDISLLQGPAQYTIWVCHGEKPCIEVLPRCFGLAGPSTGRTYTTQSRNYL